MIDEKVFAELQNRGIITVVGLEAKNFKSIDVLKNLGFATSIATNETHAEIIKEIATEDNVLEEFLAAIAAGGDVVLPMDLTIDSTIEIKKDVNIDFNGNTITVNSWTESDGSTNSYGFYVTSGTLTLTGEGGVKATDSEYSMAVWAKGGNVVINGGTYRNGGDSCDLIYLSGKSNVEINDGLFEPAGPASGIAPGTKNPYCAINIKDANRSTCKVSVKGGKFLGFNPGDNVSEGAGTNFLAEGYEAVADGDYFVVKAIEDIVVDEATEDSNA